MRAVVQVLMIALVSRFLKKSALAFGGSSYLSNNRFANAHEHADRADQIWQLRINHSR